MTESDGIYCMKAMSESNPEVCEECPLYGQTGTDHCSEEAIRVAIKALEHQIEINNMALIQSHRKCVLGRDEMYSDSTLQSMSKVELIGLLHTAQHNYSVLLETFDGRVKYYEKELAAMSDEIKFEN